MFRKKIPTTWAVIIIIICAGSSSGMLYLWKDACCNIPIINLKATASIVQEGHDSIEKMEKLFSISSVPSPKGLAFNKESEEVWVTLLLNKARGVAVFDSVSGEKIKDINLENGGGVDIIFSRDGERAYVSQMETAQVFEIDVKEKEIKRVFSTESAWTKVLALSPDEDFLYASNWTGHDVSVINLKTGKTERRFRTVKEPRGLYVTDDGKSLYVAGFKDGDIQKINLKTGEKSLLFSSGGAMRHIVGDEKKKVLYISDMATSTIWQVSLESQEVKKFAETDINPNTIVLSPDKKVLFVSCRGRNREDGNYYQAGPEWGSILFFDTDDGSMINAIVAGNQPTALDVSSDGSVLAFSNFLDASIEFYSIPSYEKLKEKGEIKRDLHREKLRKED